MTSVAYEFTHLHHRFAASDAQSCGVEVSIPTLLVVQESVSSPWEMIIQSYQAYAAMSMLGWVNEDSEIDHRVVYVQSSRIERKEYDPLITCFNLVAVVGVQKRTLSTFVIDGDLQSNRIMTRFVTRFKKSVSLVPQPSVVKHGLAHAVILASGTRAMDVSLMQSSLTGHLQRAMTPITFCSTSFTDSSQIQSADFLVRVVHEANMLVLTNPDDLAWATSSKRILCLVSTQDYATIREFRKMADAFALEVEIVELDVTCSPGLCSDSLLKLVSQVSSMCGAFAGKHPLPGDIKEGDQRSNHVNNMLENMNANNDAGYNDEPKKSEQDAFANEPQAIASEPQATQMDLQGGNGRQEQMDQAIARLSEIYDQNGQERIAANPEWARPYSNENPRELYRPISRRLIEPHPIQSRLNQRLEGRTLSRFGAWKPYRSASQRTSEERCFPDVWPMRFDICSNGLTEETGLRSTVFCHRLPLSDSTTCEATNLAFRRDLVLVSRGGEEISEVQGRDEAAEYPTLTHGFLAATCDMSIPDWDERLNMFPGNHLTAMIRAIQGGSNVEMECSAWQEKPTVMIVREEYANLFHTVRELLNTFQSLEMAGVIKNGTSPDVVRDSINVVWLDGHAKGSLDDVWTQLYGPPLRVSQLGNTCFRRIIFVHPGPRSVIHKAHVSQCDVGEAKSLAKRFAAYVLAAYELANVTMDPTLVSLVSRQPFRSHPRMPSELSVARRITNEEQLLAALGTARPDLRSTLLVTTPDKMSFRQQLEAIRRSRLVVGYHGAALMHMLFLSDGAGVVELTSRRLKNRDHYANIAYNIDADYSMELVESLRNQAAWESPKGEADSVTIPEEDFLSIVNRRLPRS